MFFSQSKKQLFTPREKTGRTVLYTQVLKNDRHFHNLFIFYFHHEPHFYLSVLFPDLYLHFETFSHDLLQVYGLSQWMDRLCAAVIEINHAHSPVKDQNFLELVSLKTGKL
jgi:hypothetical protein